MTQDSSDEVKVVPMLLPQLIVLIRSFKCKEVGTKQLSD